MSHEETIIGCLCTRWFYSDDDGWEQAHSVVEGATTDEVIATYSEIVTGPLPDFYRLWTLALELLRREDQGGLLSLLYLYAYNAYGGVGEEVLEELCRELFRRGYWQVVALAAHAAVGEDNERFLLIVAKALADAA